jgi:hypothetical protein
MVWPSFISLSVTPGPYLLSAWAKRGNAAAVIANVTNTTVMSLFNAFLQKVRAMSPLVSRYFPRISPYGFAKIIRLVNRQFFYRIGHDRSGYVNGDEFMPLQACKRGGPFHPKD